MAVKIATPESYLSARMSLLEREKECTRAYDALAAARRELPMVPITKDYTFTALDTCPPEQSSTSGQKLTCSLANLFLGRKQLIIYHFMFDPNGETGCQSCSFLADHIPDLRHLNSRDTTFVAVSRAPIEKIVAFKKRMGWTAKFPWFSSYGTDFNYDFHVTQDENVAPVNYNFMTKEELDKKGMVWFTRGEQPGLSVFYMGDSEDGKGKQVYHTYSAYARGMDPGILGTYVLLDFTPLGRQENNGEVADIREFKLHDEYDDEKVEAKSE